MAAAAALTMALLGSPAQTETQAVHQERVAKCRAVWQASAPWSYSRELCEFFVSEHEKAGIGSEWWFSMCNARYSSGLNPRMSYRVGSMWARGLMDCTQRNGPRRRFRDLGTCDLFDARVSIRNHCLEASNLHRETGREGYSLLRAVFKPSKPDGKRARREELKWQRVEKQHLTILQSWYAKRGAK